MLVIIDRFEGKFAVCEIEDGSMVDMPRQILPIESKEGDVLEVSVKISKLKTKKRKKEINQLFNELMD